MRRRGGSGGIPVGRTNDEDTILAIGPDTFHLNEELGLQATRALLIAVAALRQQRIDFVDEDDLALGVVASRHGEERPHHLLALAHLTPERRR